MLDAAQKALRFTKGKTRRDLDGDEQLVLALTRLIEILGEAAGKVSLEVCERNPAIPWKDIIGTRNRLIHGYDDVNLDILWQILSTDLPTLVENLRSALNKED